MSVEPRWIPLLFQDALVLAVSREVNPKTVTRRTSGRWAEVRPGDRIWVRETFAFGKRSDDLSPSEVGELATDAGYARPWSPTWYRADASYNGAVSLSEAERDFGGRGRWRPSIHLPRWASRLSLEVVNVRKERGWVYKMGWVYPFVGTEIVPLPRVDDEEARREGVEDRAAFLELWRAINGDAYPATLWRIEFRRIWE